MGKTYDFAGWATKNDLKCSDGRIIRKNAFAHMDGATVPLVYNHDHNNIEEVLGHALLENRPNGVYAYCSFNESENGQIAKEAVEHGDITSLSIYANNLKQNGPDVVHGQIREVSLVLAGANPGATIDFISFAHSAYNPDEEAVIYTGYEFDEVNLEHADGGKQDMAKDKTVQDVIDEMTEEQQNVLFALVGKAIEDTRAEYEDDEDEDEDDEGDDKDMQHNIFESNSEKTQSNVISHSEFASIAGNAKRLGSFKEAYENFLDDNALQHDSITESAGTATYGIDGVDFLFPDARNLNVPPEFIKRDTSWVQKVMQGVHHSPFSRVKSMFADITEDEARAKGYIKGNKKKDEVFTLLKRTTDPTTIYKKQKMDRDDVIDITDFDVIAWLKTEMRGMLDEEIARAILIGDGRLSSSDDKIPEDHIRPIISDDDLFTIKALCTYTNEDDKYTEAVKTYLRNRKLYKGSGTPTLFTTEDFVTEMLLLEDKMGRPLYEDINAVARKLRVKEIVTVEVMENLKDASGNDVLGIFVNLTDYNVGADKGGAINMFDDFDIDYNQQKYLIETRCSGALTKPYSAIVLTAKAGE